MEEKLELLKLSRGILVGIFVLFSLLFLLSTAQIPIVWNIIISFLLAFEAGWFAGDYKKMLEIHKKCVPHIPKAIFIIIAIGLPLLTIPTADILIKNLGPNYIGVQFYDWVNNSLESIHPFLSISDSPSHEGLYTVAVGMSILIAYIVLFSNQNWRNGKNKKFSFPLFAFYGLCGYLVGSSLPLIVPFIFPIVVLLLCFLLLPCIGIYAIALLSRVCADKTLGAITVGIAFGGFVGLLSGAMIDQSIGVICKSGSVGLLSGLTGGILFSIIGHIPIIRRFAYLFSESNENKEVIQTIA